MTYYHRSGFKCDRCQDLIWAPMGTLEFFSEQLTGAMDLCDMCAMWIIDLLKHFPVEQLTDDYFTTMSEPSDVDVAAHHGDCRCVECDPDVAWELQRTG